MKLEQIQMRQWKVTTPNGTKFTCGIIPGTDTFEIFTDKLKLTLYFKKYIGSVFAQLHEFNQQVKLKAFPYREGDYDYKVLTEGVEDLLRSLDIPTHIVEYGDEEQDYKPYEYEVCFQDGKFEYREQLDDGSLNIYSLIKYGDLRTLVIGRCKYTPSGQIKETRLHYLNTRQDIGAMSSEEAIQYFN